MNKIVLLFVALCTSMTMIFADDSSASQEKKPVEKNVVFTALTQNGTMLYNVPLQKDKKETLSILSFNEFKRRFEIAWYLDVDGTWKKTDMKDMTDVNGLPSLEYLETSSEFQWTTQLELTIHSMETKTLSRPPTL